MFYYGSICSLRWKLIIERTCFKVMYIIILTKEPYFYQIILMRAVSLDTYPYSPLPSPHTNIFPFASSFSWKINSFRMNRIYLKDTHLETFRMIYSVSLKYFKLCYSSE